MTDTLVKDYGCGQLRHNGQHLYQTGEHWLFGRIDRGMSVAEARADHDDDWRTHGDAVVLAQAQRLALRGAMDEPIPSMRIRASLGELYRRCKRNLA